MVTKDLIKNFPNKSGVYFFKDDKDHILYIGKAKVLKNRIKSYFQKTNYDWKVLSILSASSKIDFITTKNELEAMLLEAELIKSNQPKFNILLKSGQPYLYLLITSPAKKLPEIKIVRTKKEKGTYFGPFLDKTSTRRVHDFLIKTFRLKLCNKKIEKGCLDYHLGICAGTCRPDFSKEDYLERLELAKFALKQDQSKFLDYLKKEIDNHNKKLEFEKSKELNSYYQAFKQTYFALQANTFGSSQIKDLSSHDIWFLTEDKKNLFLFSDKNSILRKKKFFYFVEAESDPNFYLEYFLSYYRTYNCPNSILINFDVELKDKKLYEQFLKAYHKKDHPVLIIKPEKGHFLNLMNLAKIHVEDILEKEKNLSKNLKTFLKLLVEPKTIDCFDISHKQGMWQVGSCVRFLDGKPDKDKFRKFKINTVDYQDDYACLQEIVSRRYKSFKDLPDLILIDGGKGQLSSVKKIFKDLKFDQKISTEIISLAKKEETIFSDKFSDGKKLNTQDYLAQILISLRDYAHHFAISYHRKIAKI